MRISLFQAFNCYLRLTLYYTIIKGAVSRRNSAKLGNNKMPVKLRET